MSISRGDWKDEGFADAESQRKWNEIAVKNAKESKRNWGLGLIFLGVLTLPFGVGIAFIVVGALIVSTS